MKQIVRSNLFVLDIHEEYVKRSSKFTRSRHYNDLQALDLVHVALYKRSHSRTLIQKESCNPLQGWTLETIYWKEWHVDMRLICGSEICTDKYIWVDMRTKSMQQKHMMLQLWRAKAWMSRQISQLIGTLLNKYSLYHTYWTSWLSLDFQKMKRWDGELRKAKICISSACMLRLVPHFPCDAPLGVN